ARVSLSAVKVSRLIPLKSNSKARLSPEWIEFFSRLTERQAHLWVSRLSRHASGPGIAPAGINRRGLSGLIESGGKGSLHRNPNALQRQVTLIWNRAAADPDLGLKLLSVPSFRGPPKRIDQSLLPASFREDQGRYLAWRAVSDPFATDARNKPLAPRTL